MLPLSVVSPKTKRIRYYLSACLIFIFLIAPAFGYNLSTNQSADVVVGQPDFVSNAVGTAANGLNKPTSVYSDGTRLFVADRQNNRVLIFNSIPTSNNASADVVVGQVDFTHNLLNQTGNAADAGANTLNSPAGVHSDGTRLFVAEWGNDRVLIFNTIPTSNNASADVVVGQANFAGYLPNQEGGINGNTLNDPNSVYSDGTRLFIGDPTNNRVLIFNSIPTSNNASADLVLGQANFVSGLDNQGIGHPEAYTLAGTTVYLDDTRLFISDGANSRILVFNSVPTVNNASADIVLGQADFVSALAPDPPDANTLNKPNSGYSDGIRLFVTDRLNNRILIYNIATCHSSKVTKTANKETAQIGDIITYKVSITNNEGALFKGVRVADTIPAGFRYVKGSAFKNNTSIDDPTATGRRYVFDLGDISATGITTLTYQLLVTGAVHPGRRYVNVARVTDSTGHLNISARIEKPIRIVRGPLLDTVIGKVFVDNLSST